VKSDIFKQIGPRQFLCGVSGWKCVFRRLLWSAAASGWLMLAGASAFQAQVAKLPPRVAEAQRFRAQRGWMRRVTIGSRSGALVRAHVSPLNTSSSSSAAWQALGPTAIQTTAFNFVTGRVSALALDPADTTGNRLYLGATGGGVWVAQNAGTASASNIVFMPLTDTVGALNGVTDASISIGALTVQPGGTGVILAGTGDPNDVLDSYYGAGILRSTDSGNTWTLISRTDDVEAGLGVEDVTFLGEGFAGFAWSTVTPQLVVAAVSQAYEGTLVNAVQTGSSYEGLYYSQDSGATWHMATISDSGGTVQGPTSTLARPDGNAATSVVWNPVRKLFIAAVRFHGYYQSADGVTWTRMSRQPGSALTTSLCPANLGTTGSTACPIYRGTLAVNPSTGDTFAWTVDVNNQDQGLWQDQCALSGSQCGNTTVTFNKQWSTTALETSTSAGAATILDGSYTLALAAVPSGQDTLLFAGGDDLWKCSVAGGCTWRNTTNATSCKSAQVAPYQHALAWSTANPAEIFIGNDSGLWRSLDDAGETGAVCSSTDAEHFQNLNGTLGSLTEVESLAAQTGSAYNLLAGVGVNGATGTKNSTAMADWSQILSGYGGPVAIDSTDTENWYVNDQAGVGIYRCSQTGDCNSADFGSSPVVTDADVANDGLTMSLPAPFMVDPADASQLLIATCRVWRGPANDSGGWSTANAVSPIFSSGATTGSCGGDALIRSVAAVALAGGGEKIYVGMYGSLNGGATRAGHVFSAVVTPGSATMPTWSDLTLNPVTNDAYTLNQFGFDISSIYIDPHDATGNTVYVTVEGAENTTESIQTIYRSTDGGANWTDITSNLPETPVNSVIVDPANASTVYAATDEGVYYTTQIANCGVSASVCWSVFGSGLPPAPAVSLAASSGALVAGTYGRGIWQIPLASSASVLAVASASPASVTFADQQAQSLSAAQTVTVTNTGSTALLVSSIAISGDFVESDDCVNASVAAGGSCAIQVRFEPSTTGTRQGQLTINANVDGGQIVVELSGTGTTASTVTLAPSTLDFGSVEVGSTSSFLSITVNNSNSSAVAVSSVIATAPFAIATNSCGTASLAAETSCQIQVKFSPTQTGSASGTLTLIDDAGTQVVELSGTGAASATDTLSSASLSFPVTVSGTTSAARTVTLTNSGGVPLTGIAVSAGSQFQTSSTCGTQLAAQSSCAISVVFAPTQVGKLTGTLSVADMLHTQSVALEGTAVAPPAFTVSPTSMTFSGRQVGVASTPQTLTVTNSGGAAMANVGFQFSGVGAADYSIASTTCGAELASGASCTAQVGFTPATGSLAASLIVSSSTERVAPATVALNGGSAFTSGVTATPAQISFSTVGIGQLSSSQTVTLSNTTGYALQALTFTASGPFAIAQNNCTASLAAGASCTVAMAFEPTSTGSVNGALTISSESLAASTTVSLTGTGFDFTAAASGSTSVTVASGQMASFTVNINPLDNLGGSFTYACGTLPSHAVCVFNPTTTTVGAGATGSFTVQVFTNSSVALMNRPAPWRILPLICGFLLLPLTLRRNRRSLWMLLVTALVASSITACAGASLSSSSSSSGSGSSSSSTTPAGTYTVPVTVSSLGVSHTVNLTLTVD
jgi:hypothetical protein